MKYTVQQCISIGKIDEDDPSGMFPNDNFLKNFLTSGYRKNCLRHMGAEVSR